MRQLVAVAGLLVPGLGLEPRRGCPQGILRLKEKGDESSLRIYNVAGRMIKELVNEDLEAGSYVRDWYGDDSRGIAVSSGTYYYRLVAQGYRETRRMVLLK